MIAKVPWVPKLLFALTISALALSGAQATISASCDALAGEKVDLPAAFTDEGQLYLRVSLKNAPERWFQLDTGTTPSAVDLAYARLAKLDLTGAKGQGAGVGADRPAYIKTSAAARAGAFSAVGVSFVAFDFAPPGPDGQPIGGLLGTSFLKDQLIVVDYRMRKAWISRGTLANCKAAQPFRLRFNIVVTRIKVDGRPIDAIVDSGGVYDLLVQPSAAAALGLSDAMAKAVSETGYGYGGKANVRVAVGPSLDVGQIHHAQSQASFIAIPLKIGVGIGTHFLRHTRMTIDYRSRKILFKEKGLR